MVERFIVRRKNTHNQCQWPVKMKTNAHMCIIASSAIFLYNLFQQVFRGSLNCDEAVTGRDNPGGLKIKTAGMYSLL